ncbi:MAG: SusD/RagB family nutrient-binding outer membrane lipoprotein [Bacteroidota bacterium]
MKRYISYLFCLGLLMVANSCQDGFDGVLDINDNPLAATSADANLLFPTALVQFSNNRTIEVSGRTSAIVQYTEPAFGVFGSYALCDAGNTFLVGNTWQQVYATTLKNLKLVERDAAAAEPPVNNVVAQSKIMQAFAFYMLTNLYEDIPFSEALNTEIETPGFDNQESVLRGIVTMIDEAVRMIDQAEGAGKVSTGDLIYGGDLEKWEKFANSIKLKTLFLIANKDGSVGSEISATLGSPIINTLADEAEFKYYDQTGDFNPIWNTLNRFSGGSNPTWWAGSETFQTIMEDLDDPRLSTFYSESDSDDDLGTGEFKPGAVPGTYGTTSGENSIVSLNILRPDYPDRYITASEILLLHAEAIIEGYASGDADEKYREGIQSNMDFYDGKPGEIAAEDKEAYLASLPSINDLSKDDALEAIHLQLYIQNFFRMPEGWTQWRRTKVPDLALPQRTTCGDIVRRFFYPPDEVGANPNAPSPVPFDTPMWYEK